MQNKKIKITKDTIQFIKPGTILKDSINTWQVLFINKIVNNNRTFYTIQCIDEHGQNIYGLTATNIYGMYFIMED